MSMRTFTGQSLQEVAFPIGGIGTGTVSLGGRGQLQDWEIFNRPGKQKNLPYTFFCIYAEPEGRPGIARVLERRIMPPYTAGFGLPTSKVSGLPRLKEAIFHGEYPLARIEFQEDDLPVMVSLEAYNPFIPMDTTGSGTPTALFDWTVTNPLDVPVSVTIAGSLMNAVGYNGQDTFANRFHPTFGSNLNSWRSEDYLEGIFMSSSKYDPASTLYGSMAIATEWPDTTFKLRWERAGWWDDVQNFWDEFTQGRGTLNSLPAESSSPDGQTDVGTLGLKVTLEPGQTATLPFIISWCFPNLHNTWNGEDAVKGKRLGNWYARQWPDAWEAARYIAENRERLDAETRMYHQALFTSTLPAEVLDAASANASIVRTTTVLRTEDGRMNAFEGCGDNSGCCAMNCTHVWNYVQAVAYLFPELERSVRLTDFQHNTRQNGDMAFRTLLPLVGQLWAHMPAADGQMGTVMKVYREWLQCGDLEFLNSVWPGVVRAMEHCWQPGSWDADKDGVMEGKQHNTYDIEFYGPNTMMGSFYLGALRAAEELARVVGDAERAEEYRAVYESGRAKYSSLLFNGEFYRQIVNTPYWEATRPPVSKETHPDSMVLDTEPRYQYGEGCLADQLLGQWFARVVGLGDVLPADELKATLSAIHRYNFKSDLTQHECVQRVYALNDEGGLLLCTWPNGGRPKYPFPYADEVWTGIEYQVAAHCIYEGLVEEGLEMVRAVRDRHDGLKRNPWNEFECGHHYARAMASWSLILAMSGFCFNAGAGRLEVAPRGDLSDYRCFYSSGTQWGSFTLSVIGSTAVFNLLPAWGSASYQEFAFPGIAGIVSASLDGSPIEIRSTDNGTVSFVHKVQVLPGQQLTITARAEKV
jgi:non-lysosomal glucosylceramidase